ncbi:uncharacterized protein LOC128885499 [Hylaeus anthracinus]|uniref:uncharacterized protein LOC128885499 n=1 Tax=Hylaeus anthracinus TaxID=313031 RepID=UPI0023B8FF85|nr:uncharacterized protein LOC128885499 [Hylaeus anthracinus]
MRTDGGPTAIRVSCSLNMSDLQSQNSFDFVPKSDYNEKWHLENKCFFHNQQFLDGSKCDMENSYVKDQSPCNAYPHSDEKFKFKTDGNALSQISGDWKYDELIDHTLSDNIIHEAVIPDWKWKTPYSVSDLDRSNQWKDGDFASGNDISTSLLPNPCNKIESCYEDSAIIDTKTNYLHNFREYLVNYQESCGVPRTEYSFSALIRIMGQATGRSLLALLYVMLNVIPVAEVFLYILRFILDKIISIRNSKDLRQTIIRCIVFTTELFSIYICLIFIFGFIVLPIMQMVISITAKIML